MIAFWKLQCIGVLVPRSPLNQRRHDNSNVKSTTGASLTGVPGSVWNDRFPVVVECAWRYCTGETAEEDGVAFVLARVAIVASWEQLGSACIPRSPTLDEMLRRASVISSKDDSCCHSEGIITPSLQNQYHLVSMIVFTIKVLSGSFSSIPTCSRRC